MWRERRKICLDTLWFTRGCLKTVILINQGPVVNKTELFDDFLASRSLIGAHSEHLLFYEVEDFNEQLGDLMVFTQALKLLCECVRIEFWED